MKLMVKRQKQFSGTAQHIQPPVIVQVVEERSRPCQIDAGHKAGPASDISQNDLLQKLLRLKGNPAEIPVKLHLCMGIPIFVQLYDRKLLIGNRESHSLPDNGQQGLGRFFIGISVDPQKVRHLRKCPIDRGGPVQRPLNIGGVGSQLRRTPVQIDWFLPADLKPNAYRRMVEQRVLQFSHAQLM